MYPFPQLEKYYKVFVQMLVQDFSSDSDSIPIDYDLRLLGERDQKVTTAILNRQKSLNSQKTSVLFLVRSMFFLLNCFDRCSSCKSVSIGVLLVSIES